jgi:hypothetical protein
MNTIAVKQQILEKGEPSLRYGTFARPRDWMASFLDFQIGKPEELCVEIREKTDAPLSEVTRDPVWN